MATGKEDESQEGGGLAGGRNVRLVRVEAKAPTLQIPLDPSVPLRELARIVVEEREILHVANVSLRPQHLFAEVVEAVEVEVGEELAGEVADGATPLLEGGMKPRSKMGSATAHKAWCTGSGASRYRGWRGSGADDRRRV